MTSAPAPVQEIEGPTPVSVPADHLCARCGYPSGRSRSLVCPECGWGATEAELHAAGIRREALARWRGRERGLVITRWIVVIGLYALGGGAVVKSVDATVYALVAMAGGVVATWHVGQWLAIRCRRERRETLGLVWSRSLWMLHLPWLVSPLFVGIALFTGLVDVWAGQNIPVVYPWGVMVGFFLWLVGCLVAFLAWWRTRLKLLGVSCYRPGKADAVAFVAGTIVIAGAMGLGFSAGVASAFGVAQWLGLGEYMW